MIQTYFSEIQRILDEILKTQKPVMEKTAEILADAIADRRNIFSAAATRYIGARNVLQNSGLAVINPILPRG